MPGAPVESTRDTYGTVMSGKITDDVVTIMFISTLNFTDRMRTSVGCLAGLLDGCPTGLVG